MQAFNEATKITGSHRSKIGALQTPSEATLARAAELTSHALGPGEVAEREWAAAGLRKPDLDAVRSYRLERVRSELKTRDIAAAVLFDPLNIRYATDSTNMQIWIMHNPYRYAYVPAEGPVILFEFDKCDFLAGHSNVVDEVRPCTCWMYMGAGDRMEEMAANWAAEIAELVRAHGGGNMRLALDRCNHMGLTELAKHGVEICNGEVLMETAREIKSAEEIVAMRCAIESCERSIDEMRAAMQPGIMEQALWAYLHKGNITRGGEWIETRLMSTGPRTNPWYQEVSSRKIENGDIVAFDTDLIGTYGICVDISRTWICGDKAPTAEQKNLYQMAHAQIMHNTEMLRPGVSFHDLTHKSLVYDPNEFRSYTVLYHGVGLCDEYPAIYFPGAWDAVGYDGHLEAGMVICVESYIGRKSGGEGVKLEDQILITENGPERLNNYPWEEALLS